MLISLLGIFLLISTLRGIKLKCEDKKILEEYFKEVREKEEILKNQLGTKAIGIFFIIAIAFWLTFYAISFNILFPSKLVIIPAFLTLVCIFDNIKSWKYYQKNGLKNIKFDFWELPVSIIKAVYIITFLYLYATGAC